jgi:hypothetical protein
LVKAFHHDHTTHIARGNLLARARQIYEREGIFNFIRSCFHYLVDKCLTSTPDRFRLWYYKIFKSSDTLEFRGKQYHYLFHSYCPSWRNERGPVLPIVWEIVKAYQAQGKRILEVGNVLSYVYPVNHDILDKYEIMDGIINDDVVNFHPYKQYDLIVSVFTIQWVGLKETPPDSLKFFRAISNLRRLLAPGGELVVIHSIGQNVEMDNAIRNGTIKFSEQYCLKKIGGYVWKEATWDEIRNAQYDYSVPTPTGVLIGTIRHVNSA